MNDSGRRVLWRIEAPGVFTPTSIETFAEATDINLLWRHNDDEWVLGYRIIDVPDSGAPMMQVTRLRNRPGFAIEFVTTAPVDATTLAADLKQQIEESLLMLQTSRATVQVLPAWDERLRAASNVEEYPSQTARISDLGVTVTRYLTTKDETVLAVAGAMSETIQEHDVFHAVLEGHEEREILLLLTRSGADLNLSGMTVLPGDWMRSTLAQIEVVEAHRIPDEWSIALIDAVSSSSQDDRESWSRVARDLPTGHHVRDAVVTGLR